MKVEGIKQYADELAKWAIRGEQLYSQNVCGVSIVSSSNGFNCVHICEGIDKLARAVGAWLERIDWNSPAYKYYYSFKYKGVVFFHLSNNEIFN